MPASPLERPGFEVRLTFNSKTNGRRMHRPYSSLNRRRLSRVNYKPWGRSWGPPPLDQFTDAANSYGKVTDVSITNGTSSSGDASDCVNVSNIDNTSSSGDVSGIADSNINDTSSSGDVSDRVDISNIDNISSSDDVSGIADSNINDTSSLDDVSDRVDSIVIDVSSSGVISDHVGVSIVGDISCSSSSEDVSETINSTGEYDEQLCRIVDNIIESDDDTIINQDDNRDSIDHHDLDSIHHLTTDLDSNRHLTNLDSFGPFDSITDMTDRVSHVAAQQEALSEDIGDYLDENPIDDISQNVGDLDAVIVRIEEFRSSYRSLHKELKAVMGDDESYSEKYDDRFQSMLSDMKDFIKSAKDARKAARNNEESELMSEKSSKSSSAKLLMIDSNRLISNVEKEIQVTFEELSEQDIKRRVKAVPEMEKKIDRIGKNFSEINTNCQYPEDRDELHKLSKRYDIFLPVKEKYVKDLHQAYEDKELDKEKFFKEGSLNINLGKFVGYGSDKDIYTFQTEFEKIYRNTPFKYYPDLCKHKHLGGSALALVKHVDEISEIWKRLKKTFGDPKALLSNKLDEVSKFDLGVKGKDSQKTVDSLYQLITAMKDLEKMSQKHDIENDLYYGDGLERIMQLLGDHRVTRWVSKTCELDLTRQAKWTNLVEFLEKESTVLQQKLLLLGKSSSQKDGSKDADSKSKSNEKQYGHHAGSGQDEQNDSKSSCSFCGEADHVMTRGPGFSKVIQYFSCKTFAELSPADRYKELRKKNFCFQCLLPGAIWSHKNGKCQTDFVCKNEMHKDHTLKKHVLVCEDHKDAEENKKLLEEYKKKCILKSNMPELPTHAKEISLSYHSTYEAVSDGEQDVILTKSKREDAVFMLQTIEVDGEEYTMFYDGGCGKMLCRYEAIQRIGSRAVLDTPGQMSIVGVGGVTTDAKHGVYTVTLPLFNGQPFEMTGSCMERLTEEFPRYPIQGEVENDIKCEYLTAGGDPDRLPKLPEWVGGSVDFMVGQGYNDACPKEVFRTKSGLSIYRSMFLNAGGGRGVVGGPHKKFTETNHSYHVDLRPQTDLALSFFAQQRPHSIIGTKELSRTRFYEDVGIDGCSSCHQVSFVARASTMFQEFENAGTQISYRCPTCRVCSECKDSEAYENISLKVEVEEDQISKSIVYDADKLQWTARLPFIHDPSSKLAPNLKVYRSQVIKLSK